MMRTITLEIPEETYTVIEEQAQSKGVEPARLVAEMVTDAINHMQNLEPDPLDNIIGAFDSPITDLGERHDYYIGQALLKELRGESDTD